MAFQSGQAQANVFINKYSSSQSVSQPDGQSFSHMRDEALGIQPDGRELNEFQPKPAECMRRGKRLGQFQFG